MSARMKHVMAYAFMPGVPPREVRLWKSGDNPTDYGVHKWTARSAAAVMARYDERGIPLPIDVEHNASSEAVQARKERGADEPQVTGGYAKLELRDGEPWLVFDWSAYAVEQIETRQRLFLSPDYYVDKDTKEITVLERVSLVSSPGTHHAKVLARAGHVLAKENNMDPNLALILAALKAANSADDPAAAKEAIGNLIAQIEGLAGGKSPAADAPAEPVEAEADKPVDVPPSPPAEDDKESVKASAPSAPSAGEKDLAVKLAVVEAKLAKRESDERYQASAARVPPSLEGFAKRLCASDPKGFKEFVDGLPAQPNRSVRAAAAPARGSEQTHETKVLAARAAMPAHELAELDRKFGISPRAEKAVEILSDGRVRATHNIVRKAGS